MKSCDNCSYGNLEFESHIWCSIYDELMLSNDICSFHKECEDNGSEV